MLKNIGQDSELVVLFSGPHNTRTEFRLSFEKTVSTVKNLITQVKILL